MHGLRFRTTSTEINYSFLLSVFSKPPAPYFKVEETAEEKKILTCFFNFAFGGKGGPDDELKTVVNFRPGCSMLGFCTAF